MPRHAHFKRKGNVCYFRAKVPQDVREIIGKSEVVRSLKTENYRKACEAERLDSIRFDQAIADACRQKSEQAPAATLSDHEVERLALLWRHEQTGFDLDERVARGDQPDLDLVITDEMERLDAARLKGDYRPVERDVDIILAEQKLHIPRGSEAWSKLAFHLIRAKLKLFETMLERNAGKWLKLPELPTATATATGGGTTLREILGKWVAERRPPAKTESEWRTAARRWEELVGDLPVSQVTRRQVSGFKDDLLRLPARLSRELAKLPATEQIAKAEKLRLNTLSVGAVKKQIAAYSQTAAV